MSVESHLPPRNGDGDRAKRGGGGFPPLPRPIVARARKLRSAMSVPERLLWQQLRLRPAGLKFRRQHPIGPYVVDFCCLSEKLAVEIDGKSQDMGQNPGRDMARDTFIIDNGFKVLRIAAARVIADATGTAEAIVARVASPLHRPADGPPPRSGEAI